jgi:hypothetical protein
MINVGDKVICLKDYVVYGFLSKHTYKENKIYEVLTSEIGVSQYRIFINDEENAGLWFDLITNKDFYSKYFITLAEWREQQIKIVLDD